MFEEQGQYIKQECANISKLIDDIWYHRLTHEQIMCYVKELHNQREFYQQQYTAVVAQNKSLQMELRLANRIIDSMAETLAVDDDCNNWNEVITCQPETIPCEECIKKYYEQQALQELEAEND